MFVTVDIFGYKATNGDRGTVVFTATLNKILNDNSRNEQRCLFDTLMLCWPPQSRYNGDGSAVAGALTSVLFVHVCPERFLVSTVLPDNASLSRIKI